MGCTCTFRINGVDIKMKPKKVMKINTPTDLKNFRFVCGDMSRQDLAERVGWSYDSIRSMEVGRRRITKSFLLHLKDAVEKGKFEEFLK